MSDPAVEAIQRTKCAAWAFVDPPGAAEDIAERAAREALKPLRKLHHSTTATYTSPRNSHADYQIVECAECAVSWPCDTARLVYPAADLTPEQP